MKILHRLYECTGMHQLQRHKHVFVFSDFPHEGEILQPSHQFYVSTYDSDQ